jgi:multiple sugar transport system ATP-binding protein
MAVVRLEAISKRFAGAAAPAVDDVSLRIEDGEFMVLLGPSGCGKSTTLRMIAGLEAISAGELWIDDALMNRVPAKDRDIAMVFQSYALYPHMNVKDNLAFGLKRRGVPRDELQRRVEAAARMLGLQDLLERKPYALSGGQRQRVALGRAIVRDPKVFLFDEPLSNLDAQLRNELRIEIKRLHQRLGSTTMIYVTHDQIEALTLADRIAVMKDQRIQQLGTPSEIYNRPANLFVAGFVGSPRMNFVEGRLEADGNRLLFVKDRRRLALDGYAFGGRPEAGAPVTLGVRPEHLTPVEDGADWPDFRVEIVADGGLSLEVRVPGDQTIASGTRLGLSLDPQRVSLFTPESGARL